MTSDNLESKIGSTTTSLVTATLAGAVVEYFFPTYTIIEKAARAVFVGLISPLFHKARSSEISMRESLKKYFLPISLGMYAGGAVTDYVTT